MATLEMLRKDIYEDRKLFGPKLLENIVKGRTSSTISPIPEQPEKDAEEIEREKFDEMVKVDQEQLAQTNLFPDQYKNLKFDKLMPDMPDPKPSIAVFSPAKPSEPEHVPSAVLLRIKKTIEQKINPELVPPKEYNEEDRPSSPIEYEDLHRTSSEDLNVLYSDLPDALISLGQKLSREVRKERFPSQVATRIAPTPPRVISAPKLPTLPPLPKIIHKLPEQDEKSLKPERQKSYGDLLLESRDRIRRHQSLTSNLKKADQLMKDKMRLDKIKLKIQQKLEYAVKDNDDSLLKELQSDLREIETAYREITIRQQELQEEIANEQEEEEEEEEEVQYEMEEVVEYEEEVEYYEESEMMEEYLQIEEELEKIKKRLSFCTSPKKSASIESLPRKSTTLTKKISIHDKLLQKLKSLILLEKKSKSSLIMLQYLQEIQKLKTESEYLELVSEKSLKTFPFDYSFGKSDLGEFKFDVKYRYPYQVEKLEYDDYTSPMKRAQYYLRSRRIEQFIEFLGAHLVANQPVNPVKFLIDLLERCLVYRSGCSVPPLLFELKHIESLYNSMDPMKIGEISLEQYNTGLYSLGILSKDNPSDISVTNEHLMIFKDVFITNAYRKLKEQLDLMISIPSSPLTSHYFPCRSG